MTHNDINKILLQGENERVEFKTSFNKEVIETIVAFANKSGGSIYIGISKSNNIVGVNINSESVQNWINEIKSKTEPSIIPIVESLNVNSKNIIIIKVNEYPVKPLSVQGRFFKELVIQIT
jgi:ATP-dependent DNA helicase RecG